MRARTLLPWLVVVLVACAGRTLPSSEAPLARPGGLGPVDFGAPLDDAVARLEARLGAPDETTGWQDPAVASQFGVCPGDRLKGVRWGRTWLLFAEGRTRFADGPAHLFEWEAGEWFGEGFGPRTAEGIGLGSTVAELRQTYEDVDTFPPDGPFPARFRVELGAGPIHGSLSDTTADGTVTFLVAGQACGE